MKGLLTPFKRNRFNYLLYGAFFGVCFPTIAYFILDNPQLLFAIICTAPFFLGGLAFYAGLKQDSIEKRVAVRTKELYQAKISLEDALKVKTRFLASMSHEIRTPMNAVLTCVTLLRSNTNVPENILLLDTVSQSGESLLRLINDILDLSKIEAGKMSFESIPFDIVTSVKDVYDLYKGKADQKSFILDIHNERDFPDFVEGDIVRFKQVLSNLIDNALKFSKSKVQVICSSSRSDQDVYEFKIEVIDDGIGISEENQKYLFSEFEQMDCSTTRLYGGTGLGLAICKHIADIMNGSIEVKGQLGKGMHFSFRFCLKALADGPNFEKSSSSLPLDESLAQKYPLQILVAEDNKVNQLLIKKILKKLGYDILIAENGLQAIEYYEDNQIDLIFMDMNMPQMDGIEATKILRQNYGSAVEIHALTANAFLEDKQACLAAGMNGFLTKPMRIDELSAVIAKASQNKYLKKVS